VTDDINETVFPSRALVCKGPGCGAPLSLEEQAKRYDTCVDCADLDWHEGNACDENPRWCECPEHGGGNRA